MTAKEERIGKALIEGLDAINALDFVARKREEAKKMFRDLLVEAYIDGFACAGYILGENPSIDENKLEKALDKSYDGVSIYEKIADYSENADVVSIKALTESEYHRVFGEAELDGAHEIDDARKGKEPSVYKRWNTMLDNRVRHTHRFLEGSTVDLEADFMSDDGDKAQAPGGFSKADNNANCRCWLTFVDSDGVIQEEV